MRHALMFMLSLLLAGPAVFAQDYDFDFDDMEEVDRGGEGDDGGLDDRGLDDGGLDELLDGRGEVATTDSGDKRDILRSFANQVAE